MQDNVDEMLAEVQRTIAQRRSRGEYPVGLEAELEAEFDAILASMRRPEVGTLRLADDIAVLREALGEVSGTAGASSRVPGGTAVHGAVERVVGRHTNQLAHHVRVLGESTAAALDDVQQALESNRRADERQLIEVLAGVLDRLAIVDELASSMRAVEQRLGRLELAASQHQ